MPTTEDRAQRGRGLLLVTHNAAKPTEDEITDEDLLKDTLTDLLHMCDEESIDFDTVARKATSQYEDEREKERECDAEDFADDFNEAVDESTLRKSSLPVHIHLAGTPIPFLTPKRIFLDDHNGAAECIVIEVSEAACRVVGLISE